MQNIGRENREDPFFRYKMPKVMAKKEGKGNGKKTVVVNIFDIGKSLARPSEHPMKYLGFELGCIVNYDAKKDEYNGGTVMGWFDQDELAEKVDVRISRIRGVAHASYGCWLAFFPLLLPSPTSS
jgi:translation initiation factor 5